jgi:hypothetical protein
MNGAVVSRWAFMALTTGLMGASCLGMVYISGKIQRFLEETPSLESEHDLERYKSTVACCMYAVLVCLATAFASMGVGMASLILKVIAEVDVIPAIVLWFLRFSFLGAKTGELEGRLKTIPTASAELVSARNEVVRVWERSPIPTW